MVYPKVLFPPNFIIWAWILPQSLATTSQGGKRLFRAFSPA